MIKIISYYKLYLMSDLPTPFPTPPPTVPDYDASGDLISLFIYILIIFIICYNCFRRTRAFYTHRSDIRRLRVVSGIVYDIEQAQYNFSGCMNKKDFPIEEQKNCVICFDDFQEDEDIIELKNCKHIYHKHCINEWLNVNAICPVCRKQVYLIFS